MQALSERKEPKLLGRRIATGVGIGILAGLVVASLVIAAGVPTGWAVAVVGGAFFGAATGWLLIRY